MYEAAATYPVVALVQGGALRESTRRFALQLVGLEALAPRAIG